MKKSVFFCCLNVYNHTEQFVIYMWDYWPVGKQDHTNYQKKVISNYYDNLDTIMLGKLQELVTELYLSDSEKKSDRLWERARKAMVKIKVKPAIIDHIVKTRSVEVFAKNVQDWSKIRGK